jgi:hypothetical protein
MSRDVTIPLFIILFCLIFIYGILKLKHNNKLMIAFENFVNNKNNNKNIIKDNYYKNILFTSEVAKGTWTSFNTTADDNYNVNNLTNININTTNINTNQLLSINNNNIDLGTILTYVPDNLNEPTEFKITNILNGIIIGVNNDENYSIQINLFDIKQNNEYNKTKTEQAIISLYSQDILLKKYLSYKVYNNKVGGELYKIIVANDYDVDKPPKIYNFDTYNRIVNSYVFPEKYINFTFGQTNTNIQNILENTYSGVINFSIKRVFMSPDGNTFSTKMSEPIKLNAIFNGQIPEFIEIVPFENDNKLNNFNGIYKPYQTILYFYKFTNIVSTYEYKNPQMNQRNKSVFKLQNNADNIFNNTVQFNNLNTVTQYNNYNFDITIAATVNSDYNNSTIIPFSTIFELL